MYSTETSKRKTLHYKLEFSKTCKNIPMGRYSVNYPMGNIHVFRCVLHTYTISSSSTEPIMLFPYAIASNA